MKDFSVIMPVRNNIKGLKITLGAFDLFTAQKDKLEVLLLVDTDDKDMSEYISLAESYHYTIKVYPVQPTDNFSDGYYNYAARQSTGMNIWAFNDDCYVQVKDWDDKVRKNIDVHSFFRGYYLVDTYDSTRVHEGKEFPRFPIISRKAVDLIGFFFYPQIRNWPADMAIYQLYKAVGCIVPCQEVRLQHDHIFDHESDPSKCRFMRILREDLKNGVFPVKGDDQAQMLVKAIKEGV